MPAPPTPAMARPTMSVVELCATAQIKLPSSKMAMDMMKVVLRWKYLKALPQVDWKDATVRKNAEPYQPTSCKELNSSVILGMAVATMVMSRATKKTLRMMATMTKNSLSPAPVLSARLIL